MHLLLPDEFSSLWYWAEIASRPQACHDVIKKLMRDSFMVFRNADAVKQNTQNVTDNTGR